jgi:hypothetical protein
MEPIHAHSVYTFISIGILFIMVIFIIVWTSADAKDRKFNNEYTYLREFISNSKTDRLSYSAIRNDFNDIVCYNDSQKALVKKLWSDFIYKFREFSPEVAEIEITFNKK